MTEFTSSTDKQFAVDILKGAPQPGKAWLQFDHSIGETASLISFKYKELMAIAVVLTTQCPYCLERHTAKAKALGATKEELSETIMIAVALRSGAAMGYGLLAIKLFREG